MNISSNYNTNFKGTFYISNPQKIKELIKNGKFNDAEGLHQTITDIAEFTTKNTPPSDVIGFSMTSSEKSSDLYNLAITRNGQCLNHLDWNYDDSISDAVKLSFIDSIKKSIASEKLDKLIDFYSNQAKKW